MYSSTTPPYGHPSFPRRGIPAGNHFSDTLSIQLRSHLNPLNPPNPRLKNLANLAPALHRFSSKNVESGPTIAYL